MWSRRELTRRLTPGVHVARKHEVAFACEAIARWKGWTVEPGGLAGTEDLEKIAKEAIGRVKAADVKALEECEVRERSWDILIEEARHLADQARKQAASPNRQQEEEDEDGPHP